jgi:hypothetical protein
MKIRPQFNLRFRDVEQFELVMDEAGRERISMNEWVLLRLEEASIVLRGQRVTAAKNGAGDAEIKAGGSAGVAADTVLAENKRGVKKGASGDRGKLLRGDSGTAVIERAAGRLAHAANCGCFTCKPPKGEK